MNATIKQNQALIITAIGIILTAIVAIVLSQNIVDIETGELAAFLFGALALTFTVASCLELNRLTLAVVKS